MSLFKNFVLFLIRGYQRARPLLDTVLISVFGVAHQCTQSPSCSAFTIQKIEEHGTIAGLFLGMKRILSCR